MGVLLFSVSLSFAAQGSRSGVNASRLQDAARALTSGDLHSAEKSLQAVLHSSPQDYRALDLLGVVRALQKNEREADALFRRAIQEQPGFAPAHAHLGLLLVQRDRVDDAVPHLREAIRLDPARTDASGALVHILREQAQHAETAGDHEKALSLLTEARGYAPDNPDVQFEFGMTAMQVSLAQDAIEAFTRTLQLRENDPPAVYNLGRAFMELAKFGDAREQFEHYVKLRPDDSSGHCALGMTLAALERSEEARAQFARSIALAPEQTESYFRLGLLDLNLKNWDSARENLQVVVDREPKHAAALSALGRVAFAQKHYDDALGLLQRALANDSSSREAHYYLGLTFARLGRTREAGEQFQVATQLEHAEAEHRRVVRRILDPAASKAHDSQRQ